MVSGSGMLRLFACLLLGLVVADRSASLVPVLDQYPIEASYVDKAPAKGAEEIETQPNEAVLMVDSKQMAAMPGDEFYVSWAPHAAVRTEQKQASKWYTPEYPWNTKFYEKNRTNCNNLDCCQCCNETVTPPPSCNCQPCRKENNNNCAAWFAVPNNQCKAGFGQDLTKANVSCTGADCLTACCSTKGGGPPTCVAWRRRGGKCDANFKLRPSGQLAYIRCAPGQCKKSCCMERTKPPPFDCALWFSEPTNKCPAEKQKDLTKASTPCVGTECQNTCCGGKTNKKNDCSVWKNAGGKCASGKYKLPDTAACFGNVDCQARCCLPTGEPKCQGWLQNKSNKCAAGFRKKWSTAALKCAGDAACKKTCCEPNTRLRTCPVFLKKPGCKKGTKPRTGISISKTQCSGNFDCQRKCCQHEGKPTCRSWEKDGGTCKLPQRWRPSVLAKAKYVACSKGAGANSCAKVCCYKPHTCADFQKQSPKACAKWASGSLGLRCNDGTKNSKQFKPCKQICCMPAGTCAGWLMKNRGCPLGTFQTSRKAQCNTDKECAAKCCASKGYKMCQAWGDPHHQSFSGKLTDCFASGEFDFFVSKATDEHMTLWTYRPALLSKASKLLVSWIKGFAWRVGKDVFTVKVTRKGNKYNVVSKYNGQVVSQKGKEDLPLGHRGTFMVYNRGPVPNLGSKSKGNSIFGKASSAMTWAGGDPNAKKTYTIVNFMSGTAVRLEVYHWDFPQLNVVVFKDAKLASSGICDWNSGPTDCCKYETALGKGLFGELVPRDGAKCANGPKSNPQKTCGKDFVAAKKACAKLPASWQTGCQVDYCGCLQAAKSLKQAGAIAKGSSSYGKSCLVSGVLQAYQEAQRAKA